MGTKAQLDLFVEQPLIQRDNINKSLLDMVQAKKTGQLKIPYFQRSEGVWNDSKVSEWFKTVLSGDAIGVIVTYQLTTPETGNHHPLYLADGLQRITATLKCLENPGEYGFSFGPAQAATYAASFSIPVQHRSYQSHEDALVAFQNLNAGTALTPDEFYKGELARTPEGLKLYEVIPEIVSGISSPIVRITSQRTRRSEGKMVRDALALFYQYVTETDATYFKKSLSMTINPRDDVPIERLLDQWLERTNALDQKVAAFRRFTEQQTALIRDVLEKNSGHGSSMSEGLYRLFMRVAIWRKNTGIPVNWQIQVMEATLKRTERNTTTVVFEDPDTGELKSIGLRIHALSRFFHFLDVVGVKIPETSRKKGNGAKGYDASHIKPFSKHGDGKTIFEPASLNRARGAQDMDDEYDDDELDDDEYGDEDDEQ